MKRLNLAASTLLAAALALPMSGQAADAPGVFKVPGTDSTIKLYGYVQLDTTVDFSGRTADIEDGDWATILPLVPTTTSPRGKRYNPQWYLTARTSRFGIQTSTPSAWGPVGVRLEGDFNGPNGFQSETYTNSVLFRLRHAYGTVGNLLVGQTWSTFLDFGAAPDTVDFNGPGTLALVRNPMIRYTLPLPSGLSLALAAENRRGQQRGTEAYFQSLPDLHANLSWAGDKGTLSARVVTQRLTTAPATDVAPKSGQTIGFGVSGSLKIAGDTVQAQFAGGPGIGRYLLNAVTTPFADFNAAGDVKFWSVYGVHGAYTHVWSPEFRSTAVVAYAFVQDPKIDGAVADNGVQKDFTQVFVNTFWSFTKNAEFGAEYAYGQWKSFGPNAVKGTQNRVNASFHYNFY